MFRNGAKERKNEFFKGKKIPNPQGGILASWDISSTGKNLTVNLFDAENNNEKILVCAF